MALNALEKERYVQHGYSRCLFCGGSGISGGQTEIDGNIISQEVTCEDEECGKRWRDIYILIDVEEVL